MRSGTHLQQPDVFLQCKPTSYSRVCTYYHILGLGRKYVFLHVGWVQNLNLFLVVLILVSTYRSYLGFEYKILV